MIPKVKPEWKKISEFYLGLIEKERAEDDLISEVSRDSGFVIDIRDWRASEVQEMNAQQEAWYLRLLGWAWLNGHPQGTVPDDLDKVKKIVKYEEQLNQLQRRLKKFIKLTNLIVEAQTTSSIGQNVNKHKLDLDVHEVEKIFNLELELGEVWSKFSVIEGLPGVRHNKKLTKMLMKRLFIKHVKSKAGKLKGHLKNKSKPTSSIVPIIDDSQINHSGNTSYMKHVMHTPTLTPTLDKDLVEEEGSSTYNDRKEELDLSTQEESFELTPSEGSKRKEKETKEEKEKRKSRITEDFQPEPNILTWIEVKKLRVNLELETEKFINHFMASGELKLRWQQAFKNWLLNADQWSKVNGNGLRRGVGDRADELKQRLQHEWETEDAKGVDASEAAAGDAADRSASDDDDDLPPLLS